MTNKNNSTPLGDARVNRRRSRRDGAYVTVIVLFFLLTFAVIMSSLASLTTTQLRSSRQGLVRAKALTLAEAGIDDAAQRLNPDYGGILAYGGTIPNATTLNESTGVPFGTFKTTVTEISAWKRKIVSTGTSPENASMTLAAILNIQQSKLGTDNGAIKSNGPINGSGTAQVVTIPEGEHIANLLANGEISTSGSFVTDGGLFSYDSMPEGDVANQQVISNNQLESPLQFLTDSMTAAMKEEWITQAKAGGTVTNQDTKKWGAETTVNGSKYIDGNIKLTGTDKLTFAGGGNAIVYVNGSIELSGGVLTNGVTLIVRDTFIQSGQSVYKIIEGLPTPTLFVFNEGGATTGVKLAGGGENDSQGIVYGLKGEFVVVGGSILTGAIYSGDPDAGVKSTGGFTLKYPLGMVSTVSQPGGANVAHLFEL